MYVKLFVNYDRPTTDQPIEVHHALLNRETLNFKMHNNCLLLTAMLIIIHRPYLQVLVALDLHVLFLVGLVLQPLGLLLPNENIV